MIPILDLVIATTGYVVTTSIGGWCWIAYEWRKDPIRRHRYRYGLIVGLFYVLAVIVTGNLGPSGVTLDGPVVDASMAMPFVIFSAYCALMLRRPSDSELVRADAQRWFAGLFEPRPTDEKAAQEALGAVRSSLGAPRAAVTWVRSPLEALLAHRLLESVDRAAPDSPRRWDAAIAELNAAIPPGFTPDDWADRVDAAITRLGPAPAPATNLSTLIVLDPDRLADREAESSLFPGFESLFVFGRQVRIHLQEMASVVSRFQADRVPNQMDADVWRRLAVARALVRFEGGAPQPLADGLLRLLDACGGVMLCGGGTILIDRPLESHRVDGRLHRPDGPAQTYADGWQVYAIDGVIVPRAAVEAPETLTHEDVAAWPGAARSMLMAQYGVERYRSDLVRSPELIAREPDQGMARAAIEAVGLERLIMASGTTIHSDLDLHGAARRLWSVDLQAIGVVRAVEVRNSTPDPDGSWRTYYLRVPPATRTCREAVAWTFRMDANEYTTVFES